MTRSFFLLFQAFAIFALLPPRLDARPILAFGDIRGHLEPCGCDPRTDVGGLRRVAAALTRYRSSHGDLLVLHSGNLFPKVIKDQTEASGISRAIEILIPDASLVNETELAVLGSKEKLPGIKWVLSNLKAKSDTSNIFDVISSRGVEIFGYLGAKDKRLIPFGSSLVDTWKKKTKVKSSADRVLIFSGSSSDLLKIYNSGFFGIIISSNTTKLGVEKGDQEQRDEQSLARYEKGKFLAWSVPYGGGGFLRQGGLELQEKPKTVEAALSQPAKSQSTSLPAGLSLSKVEVIHWLRSGEESGAPESISKIFNEVREASRILFRRLADQRTKDLTNSEFAGAEACASCHKSSYDVWKSSKHATAMVSLIKKSRDEDPSCVACHVVGFTAKGGYVSEEKSPALSHVQCENCHGARKLHVENPSHKPKVDARASCAECHTPPHSPGFEMTSYWKMIEHK